MSISNVGEIFWYFFLVHYDILESLSSKHLTITHCKAPESSSMGTKWEIWRAIEQCELSQLIHRKLFSTGVLVTVKCWENSVFPTLRFTVLCGMEAYGTCEIYAI